MRLPEKRGRIDAARAIDQIHYAIEHGINYFDTAVPYHMGASEPFLGRALSHGYRDRVKVATKLPHWIVEERSDMDRALRTQLANLRTDRIDYYLMHNINHGSWERLRQLGAADFMEQAKARERIRAAGFSFHSGFDDFKRIIDDYDWDFCQIQYNFLDEKNQAGTEGMEYAASKGLAVIVMEPLRGGSLASPVPPAVQAIWEEAKTRRTPAEWALRWVWNHPEVTVVLSGMNRDSHIEENIRIAGDACANSLADEELRLVQRVERTYRDLMRSGCTGCRYCMPCEEGVNIAGCFEHYDSFHLFAKKWPYSFVYAFMLGGVTDGQRGLASQCTECGTCVDKCPQHLPIPELLKEVRGNLEHVFTRPAIWMAKHFMARQRRSVLRQAERIEHQRWE
jgi:predicted aldo/keto reductase-like oxidoreductase